jgi:hypothetical protein
MGVEDITNYIQVSERIASSGQPGRQQRKYIASSEEASKVMLPGWSPDSVWKQFMNISKDDLAL